MAGVITTPLRAEAEPQQAELSKEGFGIGFRHAECRCTSATSDMLSATQNSEVIDNYLKKELSAGRFIGPLDQAFNEQLQISRFGVIPKSHQPGKWRFILDLSHPAGGSVNDGIEREVCSLRYTSLDEAVQPETWLAKLSVYRLHPEDRPLLWKRNLYADA